MKKILILGLMFMTCGCGNKLTCTYKEKYDDISINNKIEFNFKNNTYFQVDTMIFNDEKSAKEYFEDVEEYVEEYNLVLEKNKIISKLSDQIKLDTTRKELKEQYESYDYNCK